MKISGTVKGIAALVAVIAIGVGIGVVSSNKRATRPTDQPPTPQVQTDAPDQTPGGNVAPAQAARPVNPPVTRPSPIQRVQPDVAALPVPAPQNVITNWESRLDDILDADVEEQEKAKRMAELLPRLPEEGQMEVAQHLANLTLDEDFGLIARFLTDPTLPEDVLDVFLSDSLNRPNEVKLPVLLEVARNPQNPKAEEAREILELFLEEDYGTDWDQWKVKLDEWIKNNPD
jgi:hypothetical protein